MAQQQPDLTGRRAALWDLEEWVRRGEAGIGAANLAPTAIAAACWQLSVTGFNACYLEELIFSTDTAIAVTLWSPLVGLALAAVPTLSLIPFGAAPNGVSFNAGLLAPPATSKVYLTGYLPAGWCGSLLGRMKLLLNDTDLLVLQTAAVAANCAATFAFIGANS